jgi:hypothetical protein
LSIAPLHRDTRGERPMVPPHLLKRILQKIEAQKAKGHKPAKVQPDPWTAIDRLEAARP